MNSESDDVRSVVLDMLVETLERGALSHKVVKGAFPAVLYTRQERAFGERLYYGTVERAIFLDWIISSYSNVKPERIKPLIKNILRMSIYQMLFMDSVPDRAAVSEAVKLTKDRGLDGLAPYVNGLLRSFQRGGIKPGMPENVKCSAPLWMYEMIVNEHSKSLADKFFKACEEPAEGLCARVVFKNGSKDEVINTLLDEGADVWVFDESDAAVEIANLGDITASKVFKKGQIFIQDLSSIMVGEETKKAAEGSRVERVVDLCASPGGKSLHIAELFPEASVLSRDISKEKTELIEENITRLKIENIVTEVFDASVTDKSLREKADIVIADLPCSGLGVLRKKPDIKFRLKKEDIAALSSLQRDILDASYRYVKKGGLLVYSTCTVTYAENQDNARYIREQLPFEQISEKQFIPGRDDQDGFYIAIFRRLDIDDTKY